MKRSWTVTIQGRAPFVMILMEDCDPLQVVLSIWGEGEVA